ncbi:hypothetical protein [Seonamhaeicola sp.]|uniref:hypothetical protein n=1 Tax=Seonamhaeicola sp. TaxID=1912245 RepID=UPI002638F196|nr:hypothetical protein [Seonamhaeicola sp.]
MDDIYRIVFPFHSMVSTGRADYAPYLWFTIVACAVYSSHSSDGGVHHLGYWKILESIV